MTERSTVDEIRARFDADVERFSNLDTGQATAIDARLMLDLLAEAAAAVTPHARDVLDIGCGAGNDTLRLLQELPGLRADLVDLSRPMLDRAVERVGAVAQHAPTAIQADIRDLDLGEGRYDLVVTGAALHHLRTEAEWEAVFASVHRALRPGGSFWVSDLVAHDIEAVQARMWQRYGATLADLRDEAYRDHVFAYIAREDTPRSLVYQLDLLRRVGFRSVDVLHKSSVFAAFGGVR
ncbi:MAG: class I SAM-dependent methyltransferase [Bacteroidota bacterium]